MQIGSSSDLYLANSLTELGLFYRSACPCVLCFEISFALRVAWFTVLSCKGFKETENFKISLIIICDCIHCSSEQAEIH